MKRYSYQNNYLFLSPVIFIGVWEIIARLVGNSMIFPDILDIFNSLVNIIKNRDFLIILFNTLKKATISLVVSLFLGSMLGVLSYRYKFFYLIFFPFINFIKSIPTIAVIILVLIWSKVEFFPFFAGMMIVLPIIYENILGGIESIDNDLVKMAKIYNVSKFLIFKDIYLSGVYFFLAPSLSAIIGLTLKVIIAGEVLAQDSLSIGGEIFMGKIYLESATIFAWIIIIILVNFLIEITIKNFNLKLNRWRE